MERPTKAWDTRERTKKNLLLGRPSRRHLRPYVCEKVGAFAVIALQALHIVELESPFIAGEAGETQAPKYPLQRVLAGRKLCSASTAFELGSLCYPHSCVIDTSTTRAAKENPSSLLDI